MIQSAGFMLCELNDIPYLLPFGQGIADMRLGVRLNDTGAYLWGLLASERSEEEILSLCAAHFQAEDSELPLLKADVLRFLDQLRTRGIIEDKSVSPKPAGEGLSLRIGGLNLLLTGAAEPIADSFSHFPAEAKDAFFPDQIIEIRPFPPAVRPLGRALLRSNDLIVLENKTGFVLIFPAAANPLEALISFDGSRVILSAAGAFTEPFIKDVFHAVRVCFLYLAQQKGLFALHSASFLYRDRIWLFSGHSGAGKSTHTNLWHTLMDVPLINGDLNLLDPGDGLLPAAHGLPWCGTSGISTPGSWPLGGVIFLRQASRDWVEQLPPEGQQLLLSQHMISPNWTREQAALNLKASEQICSRIPVCRLCCTKEPEAVETIRIAMDQWLDRQ